MEEITLHIGTCFLGKIAIEKHKCFCVDGEGHLCTFGSLDAVIDRMQQTLW